MNNESILPIYLQKYFIKIICNHINRKNQKNKLYDFENIKKDLIEKENQLKITISLVCKTWFQCLSSNINVVKDFNGLCIGNGPITDEKEENEYSILKKENITTLKLVKYNNDDLEFDETLKFKIGQLKNLKRIIVCRYFSQKELIRTPQTFSLDFFNKVFKSIDSNKILIDLHISLYCNCFGFTDFSNLASSIGGSSGNCQFKVNKLKIDSCCDEESSFAIMDYIKYFNPIKLSIVPSPSSHLIDVVKNVKPDPHFKYKKIVDYSSSNGTNNNTFSFLEKLSIEKLSLEDVLSIKEIFYILKSLPNLQSLSFQMCEQYMIKKFTESELSKPRTSNLSWEKPSFYWYFEKVRELIVYHKHLSSLTIGTGCKNKCCSKHTPSTSSTELLSQQVSQQQQPSSSFNQTFSEIITSNNSIKSLSLLNFNNNNDIVNNIKLLKNIPIYNK